MEGISITRNIFHFPNSVRTGFFQSGIVIFHWQAVMKDELEIKRCLRKEWSQKFTPRGGVWCTWRLSRCHKAWWSECFCFVLKEYLNYKAYLWLHDCAHCRHLTLLEETWNLGPTSQSQFCNPIFTSPVNSCFLQTCTESNSVLSQHK